MVKPHDLWKFFGIIFMDADFGYDSGFLLWKYTAGIIFSPYME